MGHILHIGVGNFARAHLADYTADAGGWRITGVSLRSAAVRDGLRAQGWAYTLHVMGQGPKRIDVFDEVMVAPEDPQAVVAAIADPRFDVISTTVTEKGYYLGADGRLRLDDPQVAADVAGQGPTTLIGFLARGLAARQRPVTVLCCDNMEANGAKLRNAVADFAAAAGLPAPGADVAFPNAMVDRITPATTQALRDATGDPMAVPTEPFRDWVIEDAFAGAWPDWPGVQVVPDVAPYEMRKLRLLNGAHSYLAYAGTLAGHEHVHEAIADPALRAGAAALMAEAAETLPAMVRADAEAYAAALMARFEVPEIAHRLRQIAMDGTQKLPYRILATRADRAAKGLASPALDAALAAWVGFCAAEIAAGHTIDDPRSGEIAAVVRSGGDVRALLGV